MQSIYWAITRNCTQSCDHCYMSCGPGQESLSERDAERIIGNFPEKVDQVIISGGEVLTVKPLLFRAIDLLYSRFGDTTRYMMQTNGDLLDERAVEELLEHHFSRIDIASIDDYHHNRQSREQLERLLNAKGVTYLEFPNFFDEDGNIPPAAYSFWGATPQLWLGGVWPRGRALENGLWSKIPSHNFCGIWSGGLGFLDNDSPLQEINIRLSDVFPCCPVTKAPLGDLREKPLLDILDDHRDDPVFQALNRGEPEAMGVEHGISIEQARARIEQLGSCCLWCDEFFERRFQGGNA